MYKPNMEDKMNKAIIINKSSVELHGLPAGKQKKIEVTETGIPKERIWRRRLEDAKIDNCVELQIKKKTIKKEVKD